MNKHKVLTIVWVVLLAGALTVIGCKKKQPTTTDDAMSTSEVEAPEEVTAPTTPTTTGDEVKSPLEGDLQAANEYAYGEGLLGDVYFAFDEYSLSPEARERLAQNADFMKANGAFVLSIEGHCDERGTNEYNLALGDRRANAAKNYIVSLGVDGTRLQTISYGEERPVCEQSDESCWQQNRRAHFVITGRQ